MPGNSPTHHGKMISRRPAEAAHPAADAVIVLDSNRIVRYFSAGDGSPDAETSQSMAGRPLADVVPPPAYRVLSEQIRYAEQHNTPWHGILTYQRSGESAPTPKRVHIFPLSGDGDTENRRYVLIEQAVQDEASPALPANMYLEISHALGLAQDSATLTALFLNKVQDLLGIYALGIGMLHGIRPDGSYNVRITYATRPWASWIGQTVSCEHFLQQSIQEQQFIYLSDTDTMACSSCILGQNLGQVREMLIVPLAIHDGTLGVLLAGSRSPIPPRQQQELRALASMFARALHRQSLHEGLATQIELLKKTQEELVRTEKLASLGVLLAGVAHELNNPLTSIILYAQLALENNPDETARHTLEQVLKLARRAARVIHGMLEFSSRKHIRREVVSLEEVIAETLSLIRHELQSRQIRVHTSLEPDLPPVIASAVQIQQVFINLIMNAIHAIVERQGAEDGPVDGLIEISAQALSEGNKRRIRLSVQDNGIGIPPDMQSHIFDPFFTTRGMKQGTGLGLSICHGIITRYGGKIWVRSAPGQGAAFFIELPAAAPEELRLYARRGETGSLSLQRLSPPQGAYRLLVVDDEESIREIFVRVLERAGYQVDTAADGLAAWNAILRQDYDLIVCDINIPKLPGDKLYARLSQTKPQAQPRIVFITGDTHNKEIQAFLSQTNNFFLTKPFELEDFIQTIAQALETLAQQPS